MLTLFFLSTLCRLSLIRSIHWWKRPYDVSSCLLIRRNYGMNTNYRNDDQRHDLSLVDFYVNGFLFWSRLRICQRNKRSLHIAVSSTIELCLFEYSEGSSNPASRRIIMPLQSGRRHDLCFFLSSMLSVDMQSKRDSALLEWALRAFCIAFARSEFSFVGSSVREDDHSYQTTKSNWLANCWHVNPQFIRFGHLSSNQDAIDHGVFLLSMFGTRRAEHYSAIPINNADRCSTFTCASIQWKDIDASASRTDDIRVRREHVDRTQLYVDWRCSSGEKSAVLMDWCAWRESSLSRRYGDNAFVRLGSRFNASLCFERTIPNSSASHRRYSEKWAAHKTRCVRGCSLSCPQTHLLRSSEPKDARRTNQLLSQREHPHHLPRKAHRHLRSSEKSVHDRLDWTNISVSV